VAHVLLAHPACHPALLPQHHRVQPVQQDRLVDQQVALLYLSAALLLLLEHLVLLAVARGLQVVSGTVRRVLVVVVLVVIVVGVDDGDELLELLAGLNPLRGDLLVADVE